MQNFSSKEILALDKASYSKYFENSDFGLSLGKEIALKHGYKDQIIRIPEGSSLVFKLGTDYFLKITPPYFKGSIEAEIAATIIIGQQLPFSIPEILIDGVIGNWKYVITRMVKGRQAKFIYKTLSAQNMKTFAMDIGKIIRSISLINSDGFERDTGTWETYLSNNLKNQESIHLGRGNSPEWAEKINRFIQEQSALLQSLGPAKLIHADLNHEHLMLEEIQNEWRVTGVLDFADSMNAPVELEFILPIVCFFKGNAELQRLMWTSSEHTPRFRPEEYSNIMMALTLQNRFIAFHDWFRKEIEEGAVTVEEIAIKIFPMFNFKN